MRTHLRCDPPSASSPYMEYKPSAAKPVFAVDRLSADMSRVAAPPDHRRPAEGGRVMGESLSDLASRQGGGGGPFRHRNVFSETIDFPASLRFSILQICVPQRHRRGHFTCTEWVGLNGRYVFCVGGRLWGPTPCTACGGRASPTGPAACRSTWSSGWPATATWPPPSGTTSRCGRRTCRRPGGWGLSY